MSDIASYPRQDNYETTLVSEIAAGDLSMVVSDAPSFALSSGTCYMTIDPGLSTQETVVVTGVSSTTLTITRAAALYEGATSTAYAHSGGAKVVMSNNWNYYNDIVTSAATKLDETGGTMSGKLQFSGTTHAGVQLISLTTTERNALTPVNGDIVYDETLGQNYQYIAGSWNAVDAGTVFSNASSSAAGKVEMATYTEAKDGDTTGGTGAYLVMHPNTISSIVQLSGWTYAADAEASDTYAITLDRAPTAYAEGHLFHFKANTANTGAATLNVNALGALAILKNDDEVLTDGDIQAGQIVSVVHDGTQFQMVSPTAAQMSVANKDTLTDGSDASLLHIHTVACGEDSFTPTAVENTKVIAHGLGRVPNFVKVTWGVTTAVNAFNASGQGVAIWNGTQYDINRKTQSAGNAAWYNEFGVNDDNDSTVDWYGTLTADATNITIGLSSYNNSVGIAFIWEAY
jgi:hypothetical protein